MSFIKHGSPEKIEVIKDSTVDTVICRKCGHVLIRANTGSTISFSGNGVMITCGKCGEVNHGV